MGRNEVFPFNMSTFVHSMSQRRGVLIVRSTQVRASSPGTSQARHYSYSAALAFTRVERNKTGDFNDGVSVALQWAWIPSFGGGGGGG